jgi:hypothetical protein
MRLRLLLRAKKEINLLLKKPPRKKLVSSLKIGDGPQLTASQKIFLKFSLRQRDFL